jgi:hypothetical protein
MMSEEPSILSKIGGAVRDLLNHLNMLGSILLAYALANPTAATELLNLLPADLKKPAVLLLPAAWFILVQYAKGRAIKKATKAG